MHCQDIELDINAFIPYEEVHDKNEKRNREVLLVPQVEVSENEKRKFNFKDCTIKDADFIIDEKQYEIIRNYQHKGVNLLKRNESRTFKHKSFNMALGKMLKTNYNRMHNNVCIIYFEKFNQSQRNGITAYGYCSHLTCNSYKFVIKEKGQQMDVTCYRNQMSMATHPIGVQLTSQIRNIERLMMAKSLMHRKASDIKTDMDFNLAEELTEVGTATTKDRKVLDQVRSEYLLDSVDKG